jgi:predicted nuclease of predicted toxin-antitoxin system
MRFLADQSCDFAAVQALRSAGPDVVALSQFQQRSVDDEVIELAQSEERILLTEDKDFGWLAFVPRRQSFGVVLIQHQREAHWLARSCKW